MKQVFHMAKHIQWIISSYVVKQKDWKGSWEGNIGNVVPYQIVKFMDPSCVMQSGSSQKEI